MPSGEYRRGKIRVCQRGVGNRDLPPDPASHIGPNGISDSRVQIFPHIIDLTNSSDQGGGFIGFAKRIVHPFSDTEPDCYLNSNAPADFFNISVFPARSNGMRTPRRGRPYERNADAWVFRKSSAPLLLNSPFHGFTNARHQYVDVKRCGDLIVFYRAFCNSTPTACEDRDMQNS